MSLRTVNFQRVLAVHLPSGDSLLISKSLDPTGKVIKRLGTILLIVGGLGMAVAAIAGGTVARTGLRPVARLTDAAERVARTDDLRPIPVHGSDELARLTEAFNMMLRALAESRERQARLVTDAGHELRTPLTSLRTNVELLMASMAPGAPSIPDEEMAGLRTDVIAQIEELSTLVGDLVDLTRDDAGVTIHEPVDLSDVVYRSLERVRRRRNDIEFDVQTIRWQVYGDEAGLSRAVLNLLDNAAKWSPPNGRVAVRMAQIDPMQAELVVSDFGQGIPPRRARAGVREVLPVDRGAGDDGLGSGPGDRQAGRRETWWRTSDRRHGAGSRPAGDVDSPGAARQVAARRAAQALPRHAQAARWTGCPATPTMGELGVGREKSGQVPNDL